MQFIAKLWQLALYLTHNDQGDKGADAQRKHLEVRKGICMKSREIHMSCSDRVGYHPFNEYYAKKSRFSLTSCKLYINSKKNDLNVEMCKTLVNHYDDDPSILDNIWFSNQAVFYLSGRVNRHNNQI